MTQSGQQHDAVKTKVNIVKKTLLCILCTYIVKQINYYYVLHFLKLQTYFIATCILKICNKNEITELIFLKSTDQMRPTHTRRHTLTTDKKSSRIQVKFQYIHNTIVIL
jgi:hypothetical protein